MPKTPKTHAGAGKTTLCGKPIVPGINVAADSKVTCKACRGSAVFKLFGVVGGGND